MKNSSRAKACTQKNYRSASLKKPGRHMMHDSNAFVASNKKKTRPVKSEKKQPTKGAGRSSQANKPKRANWKEVTNQNGETWYFDTISKKVTWIKPADFDKQQTQLTTALKTLEKQLEETREAEETATTTTTFFFDGAIEGASKILEDASEMAYNACAPPTASINGAEEREGVEESAAVPEVVVVVVEKDEVPLSNDAVSDAVNKETTEAPSNVNAETPKSYDEMSKKLNESVSLVRNQTVNGLTTACVKAGEDLSLIGIALSQTSIGKSLSALIKGKVDYEVDYDQENEGEGMEISLDNRLVGGGSGGRAAGTGGYLAWRRHRVGNSRTVAEI